jgi:phage FluMu protein Com
MRCISRRSLIATGISSGTSLNTISHARGARVKQQRKKRIERGDARCLLCGRIYANTPRSVTNCPRCKGLLRHMPPDELALSARHSTDSHATKTSI